MAWQILGREAGPDGTEFVLYRFDDQFMIRAGGYELMSTRAHGSEEALARLGCEALVGAAAPQVLVGGLGLGYTLRAALDCLPAGAEVTVAELVPTILDWQRTVVGACCGWPLRDPRVTVHCGDVVELLVPETFDAILLDVDNGAEALSWGGNRDLYGDRGTATLYRALRPGGTLAVWSAEIDPPYAETLGRHGFAVRGLRVPARGDWDGVRHVVYLGRRESGMHPALAGGGT
ncbi:MAG: hypothetical protein P1P84_13745 [Deferrisomatales bacterium]|nr:hypothetical protein [Deferrisomatales bacterium]